ncbi:Holliday junction DNA helicase RuvA [Legionella quinlivanii]|uniref:Holliday junction branch migration complex subunit RuvA n=1 Tax=Legionella quinlivanii TaxID=45073 RepID=A0A0W0Y063_9GAMM|nr:Holliday junction branch migration protein RuvA [Legionella quinlivanii]KTD50038.1 Holliday junction DNA helicase RuvA [Legionella quinlivanii]SEF93833.1 Holliday junction DNA helicase subunit RuvA [Legionella quinlivanii DSM 21216]STY11186.1 Holliday junction ATP-dependent DNA helicase RuvA [Legionella quinlivanii]
MIGWLQGTIIDKSHPGRFVVNVNGVGYDVETSLNTFFQLEASGGQITLHIHTIVREDAFLLYGFADKLERSLFRALIKVNGVGPKLAINILSSIAPTEFIQTIVQQNAVFLTKLPGIGKKTAERLIIEMKDSIEQLMVSESLEVPKRELTVNPREQDEAIRALEALGYKLQEATKVVSRLDDGNKSCEQLIRQALKELAGRAVFS